MFRPIDVWKRYPTKTIVKPNVSLQVVCYIQSKNGRFSFMVKISKKVL